MCDEEKSCECARLLQLTRRPDRRSSEIEGTGFGRRRSVADMSTLVRLSNTPEVLPNSLSRALPTETNVERGTSQSRGETTAVLSNSGKRSTRNLCRASVAHIRHSRTWLSGKSRQNVFGCSQLPRKRPETRCVSQRGYAHPFCPPLQRPNVELLRNAKHETQARGPKHETLSTKHETRTTVIYSNCSTIMFFCFYNPKRVWPTCPAVPNCRGTSPIRKRPTPWDPPRTLGIGLR